MTEYFQFVQIDLNLHRAQIVDLNVEYMDWATKEILEHDKIDIMAVLNMSTREYVNNTIDQLCSELPPQGIYYLLQAQHKIVGMGGLRQIRAKVGEIKRMYIRPQYRGRGLGKVMLQQLLDKAKEFGYYSVYLDSAQFMKTAHRLYYSLGFVDRAEFAEAETPPPLRAHAIYMEKPYKTIYWSLREKANFQIGVS